MYVVSVDGVAEPSSENLVVVTFTRVGTMLVALVRFCVRGREGRVSVFSEFGTPLEA